MNKKKFNRILAIIGLMIAGAIGCYAQQGVVVASGSNENGTLTFAIGQVYTPVAESEEYTVASGTIGAVIVEVSVATAIEETEFIDLSVAVRPNPVVNMLSLTLATDDLNGYGAKLFDLSGHMVASAQIDAQETQIDVSGLARGTYIVAISRNGKEMKTFKVIKK